MPAPVRAFQFESSARPWQAVREWTVSGKKITGQLRAWEMPAGGRIVDATGKEHDVGLGSLSKDDVIWIGSNYQK